MTEPTWILILAAAVASGTPLVYAGLGTLMAERVGIINLGVEGMMLIGAVTSVVVFGFTQSPVLAFLASGVSGLTAAMLLCLITIPFRSNQIVAGLAITIFLTGVSILVGSTLAVETKIPLAADLPIPVLSNIPIIGDVLFRQDPYVYLSWLIAIALSFFLFHTRPGLIARSLGENPQVPAALGVSVNAMRSLYVSIGGFLVGMGGGYIAVAILGFWTAAATVAGQGWIAIALVIVAAWRPLRLLAGAYMFGLITQTNFALQAAGISQVPGTLLAMLPYVITVALLTIIGITRKRTLGVVPGALGVPFIPGER